MAKLVQKSGYIKSGKAGGYMRYIATREGVERLAGNGAVTKGQRELIQKLLTDFPDAVELFEYEDYCKTPTLGTASTFITMALDANLHEIDSESGYMQYIATRPRVQKRGTHGLFSSATAVDLASAISELEAHEGNVWTIIYSLRREDAARLVEKQKEKKTCILSFDLYPGVRKEEMMELANALQPDRIFDIEDCAKDEETLLREFNDYITDDRVFGIMCHKTIDTWFESEKLKTMKKTIETEYVSECVEEKDTNGGLIVIIGTANSHRHGSLSICCTL